MRTVKGDPKELSNAANQLHSSLQLTFEKAKEKSNLAFLDFNVNVDSH